MKPLCPHKEKENMTSAYVALQRGKIKIGGSDRLAFLQNLITNDVRLLSPAGSALYAAFLSPQGKFLHDFILTDDGAAATLDCEGGARAEDLVRKLKMYKLRSKIELAAEPDVTVFAGWGDAPPDAIADPRHPALGWRAASRPPGTEEDFSVWDEKRIRLGVPDGSRDMEVDRDTPLECNFDRLNGVSFDKGCYVGQEITARMHLRHIIKKHLAAVECDGPVPAPGTDIHVNGQMAGQMRSGCGRIGIAMIRDDARDSLASGPIRILKD